MGRLPEIDASKLSSEQRIIYDDIMRARGHMRGPFAIWLRNAELGENTLKLQEMFASRVKLERRLLELMILVAARLATAQYAWFIHEPHALKFGISPEIVQAIRERRTPEFSREDERLVYDITMELNTTANVIRGKLSTRHGNVRRTNHGRACQRDRLLRDGRHDAKRIRCIGPHRQRAIGIEPTRSQKGTHGFHHEGHSAKFTNEGN